MAERPTVAIVNCDLLGEDGLPATVTRPMNDDEYQQWQTDQAEGLAAAAEAEVEIAAALSVADPVSRLVDALGQLPADKPVTAAELLTVLRPSDTTAAPTLGVK